MTLLDSTLAEKLEETGLAEKPAEKHISGTIPVISEDISRSADRTIKGVSASRKRPSVRPRAKHISLDTIPPRGLGVSAAASFSSGTGSEGNGTTGGGGEQGEGGGDGGDGKKKDYIPPHVITDEIPSSQRSEPIFPLEDRLSKHEVARLYALARHEELPDADEIGNETRTVDHRLRKWAESKGIRYVEPSGYDDKHNTFVREKYLNHATRRSNISKVREQLEEHITYLRMFQVNIKRAMPKAQSKLSEGDSFNEVLNGYLNSAFDGLIGSMPQSNRELIQEELNQLGEMVRALGESYNRDLELQIVAAARSLEGVLRYRMEARDSTYRSINLIPDSLRQLLGKEDMDSVLLDESGEAKMICDFGSGDGETMIQLGTELRKILERKIFEDLYRKVKERCRERFGTDEIGKLPYDEVRKVETEFLKEMFDMKRKIGKDIKSHLLCIDQAHLFIERLTDKKGIGGVVADLCQPSDRFFDATGIEPGSVQLGISSLTIDRARDVDQLLRNISLSLADDGSLVLLTKSTHSSRTDGAAAAADAFSQIEYSGTTDLKTRDRIQLLDNIKNVLAKYGLRIESAGRHHGRVISTDVSGNNVQIYRLLAIVCKKIPGFKPEQ